LSPLTGSEIQDQINQATMVLQRKKSEFLKLFGIEQFGVGFKMKAGQILPQVALVFIVRRKLPLEALKDFKIDAVPQLLEGIATDVLEVPHGFQARQNDARWRPFLGGDAGIHYQVRASGTFAVTTINPNTGEYETLTNNHVGADEDIEGYDFAHRGDAWIQPGAHGGGTYPNDKVCELDRWKKILPRTQTPSRCPVGRTGENLQPGNWLAIALGRRGRYKYVNPPSGQKNLIDAAVGRVVNKSDATPYEIRNIGAIKGWKSPSLNDRVMKMGRTTELTRGMVSVMNLNVTINYRGFDADFENQIAVFGDAGAFSQPGDSGSLIVTEDPDPSTNKPKATALLFAGGRTVTGTDITIANPIEHVIQGLNYNFD